MSSPVSARSSAAFAGVWPAVVPTGSSAPDRYIVTPEVSDLERLNRDMAGEEMQRLLSELHGIAEVTHLATERFE